MFIVFHSDSFFVAWQTS